MILIDLIWDTSSIFQNKVHVLCISKNFVDILGKKTEHSVKKDDTGRL